MPEIQPIIKAAKALNAPSQLVLKGLQVLSSPSHERIDLVNLIKTDPQGTAALLKLANSAQYNRSNRSISTVDRAVGFLGEAEIMQALLLPAIHSLQERDLSAYGFKEEDFASFSHHLGLAAQVTAKLYGTVDPGLAYTAGLLADIGKLVLASFMQTDQPDVVEQLGKKAFYVLETESVGLSHIQVGVMLAQHWKLPQLLQDAIAYHHHPSLAPAESAELARIVHIGDMVAQLTSPLSLIDTLGYPFDTALEDKTPTEHELEQIIAGVHQLLYTPKEENT